MDQSVQPSPSKSSNSSNTLLQQSLTHLPNPLPQPIQTLQSNLNYIPHYLMNDDLYKQIHSMNRNLIYEIFQALADLVLDFWQKYVTISKKMDSKQYEQFLKELCQQVKNEQPNGNYYVNRIISNKETILLSNSNSQFIRNILCSLAQSNLEYYGLAKHPQTLPQKYESTIQLKLNMVSEPVKNNYFEQLIMSPVYSTQNTASLKTQEQVEADANADFLCDFFDFRRSGELPIQKRKSLKRGDSTVNFFPFVVSRGNKKPSQQKQPLSNCQPISLPLQPQQLLDQILTFCIKFTSQKPQNQSHGQNIIQISNSVTNTYSQMTYYQSHMMMHMANLIFYNSDKFDTRLIKCEPFWQVLLKRLEQQIQQIQSQDFVLNQNVRQYGKSLPEKNIINQAPKKKQQKQSKNKSMGQKLMSKAKDKLTQLYTTARQQLKFQKIKTQNSYNSLPTTTSPCSILSSSNKDTVMELENMKSYIFKIMDIQIHKHSSSNRIIDNLRNFADELKNKIFHDDTPYYYDMQAWMAIIIVLFKQLTLNPTMNYHYSPYKRRVIINICKKMFKWENKINMSDQNKQNEQKVDDKQEIQFKNWPIILKYLQNNRQQVILPPPITQKQTQKIIEQISLLISQKRLLGSTFGNLFEGIEQLKQNIPSIKLVCLSNGANTNNKSKDHQQAGSQQCKVVHILISGFLSQDTDKFDQWADMIQTMPNSQIYALVWESSTIKDLVKFFLKSAVDIIAAIKMMDQLRKKYTDNPFNPAFEVAQLTGRILAQLVIRTFPNRFINVCGYSLGSQVIKQFVNRIIQKNSQHLLNNIYIMGGVSDNESMSKILQSSRCPLSLYNCYTNNDLVLKHLLSRCKPGIKPMGLFQVQQVSGHKVTNIDCSKFISGHLKFRSNLKLMGEILDMSIG